MNDIYIDPNDVKAVYYEVQDGDEILCITDYLNGEKDCIRVPAPKPPLRVINEIPWEILTAILSVVVYLGLLIYWIFNI